MKILARRTRVAVVAVALALAGCATQQPPSTSAAAPAPRPAPQAALAPAADGPFATIEAGIRAQHGPDVSGFWLLDRNDDGLRWRLALIDSAKSSIDMQYYLWYGDTAGSLLLVRALDAANRGVRVRLLIDDLNSLLQTAGKVKIRDEVFSMIDAHPNIELRLFNPWKERGLVARAGEAIGDLKRLNQRMHNKVMIVDNRAAVLGGRNLGDEYFGLSTDFNFHDLDVLGFGPVARQSSAVFDAYWNSAWVMPVSALNVPFKHEDAKAAAVTVRQWLASEKSLAEFSTTPRSWQAELATVTADLRYGTSTVKSDMPVDGRIQHNMLDEMNALAATAQKELLIINAYIIPGDRFIEQLQRMKAQGITVKILTNSLASHDVPAVNSHYKQWRRKLRENSTALHEMRHDGQIQSGIVDTAPTRAGFMGLHSKGMVVDRRRVYIGSMNFDPRSANINSEMGVLVDSPALAEDLARLIERDLQPANSWRVEIEPNGAVVWIHDTDKVSMQPARSLWQRVEDLIFMAFPKELY